MPLLAPVLDDRGYDQLRLELVNRIPVYNAEWTDYNRSDPAITLLELFAHLGEGLAFRLNQVPEATKIEFLKLLGLPLRPAVPATALVRATSEGNMGVVVRGGDQLKAGSTRFTVTDDALIWPLDCVAVSRVADKLPDRDKEPELYASVMSAFQEVKRRRKDTVTPQPYKNAVLLPDGTGDTVDFGEGVDRCVWIAVLREKVLLPKGGPELPQTKEGTPIILNVGFSPAAETPALDDVRPCPGGVAPKPPALEWCATLTALKPDGTPDAVRLRVLSDHTAGLTEEGIVRLELPALLDGLGVPAPPAAPLVGTGDFPPVLDDERADRVWFWIRVWRQDESRVGKTRLVCLNALSVVQAVDARPELLGSGNGQPGQRFQLANRPVISDSAHPVSVQVHEDGTWKDWKAVDDFDSSHREHRHFVVNSADGVVEFGRYRYPQLGESVRVLGYRFGGGKVGNLPARAINKVGEPLTSWDQDNNKPLQPLATAPVKLKNPFPSSGGDDEEPLEVALDRIPRELRRRYRAVTKSDFEELAFQTPGVSLGRTECLPLFHAPDRTDRPGTVSVMVWPQSDAQHPNAPVPNAFDLRRVCEWLDGRRLVTTELFVIAPSYRQIAIAISVKVKDGYGLDAVKDWVELVLRQYLAPLPPHGPDGQGWPLGRRILARELEAVAMQVEGVEYANELRLAGRDASGGWVEGAEVTLARWEVPEVAAVRVVDGDAPAPGDAAVPPDAGALVPLPVLREEC